MQRKLRERGHGVISWSRDGPDDCLTIVADGIADLAHTMRQRFVGHDHVRPDRLDELLLGHQATSVLNEIAQDLECPRAQFDDAISRPERTARRIERISLKPVHIRWHPSSMSTLARSDNFINLQLFSGYFTRLSGLRTPFAPPSMPVPT